MLNTRIDGLDGMIPGGRRVLWPGWFIFVMVFGFLLLSVLVLIVLAYALRRTSKDLHYQLDHRHLRIECGTIHKVWMLRAVDSVRMERTGSINVVGVRYESARLVVNQVQRDPIFFHHLLVRDSDAWAEMKAVEAALNDAIARSVDRGTAEDIPTELQQARRGERPPI